MNTSVYWVKYKNHSLNNLSTVVPLHYTYYKRNSSNYPSFMNFNETDQPRNRTRQTNFNLPTE